jgi:hypothetical protein
MGSTVNAVPLLLADGDDLSDSDWEDFEKSLGATGDGKGGTDVTGASGDGLFVFEGLAIQSKGLLSV